ncbi:MAG: hypothetical protein WDO24_15900 [Pseudomonadota bacterium]
MNRRTLVVILPTALTLARLCAVPVTIWLILTDALGLAFWIFVAAGSPMRWTAPWRAGSTPAP